MAHHHHHTAAQGTSDSMTDAERLRILLDHWVEHNVAHGEEFERWAQRARGAGLEDVAREIEAAVGKLEEANASLERAMWHL